MKIYRILGKRGRVTIPFLLRQKVGFAPNDVLSFTDQDGRSILIRREALREDGGTPGSGQMTLREFLGSLPEGEQYAALVHLSVLWAERQGQKSGGSQ